MSDQWNANRPPYCMARMNEYVAIAGNDFSTHIMVSTGATDCIIFVCHQPRIKRALLCHVDRNTNIDRLIEDTHSLVSGGDFDSCNIYMISNIFCTQNYAVNGTYVKLKNAVGASPVETIGATAYALDIQNGRMRAGPQIVQLCSEVFPDAALADGAMNSMIPMQNTHATCVYKTKFMGPVASSSVGGRQRSSSGGSLNLSKKSWC